MLFTLLIYTKCNYVYSVTYPVCHGIKQVDWYFRLAEHTDGILPSRKIAQLIIDMQNARIKGSLIFAVHMKSLYASIKNQLSCNCNETTWVDFLCIIHFDVVV